MKEGEDFIVQNGLGVLSTLGTAAGFLLKNSNSIIGIGSGIITAA